MLIGISGKIGSGKDTIGDIINYLSKFTQAEARDLFYERYKYKHEEIFINRSEQFKIKKFAYKLKQIVALLTGINVEDLESHEIKDKNLPDIWNYLLAYDGDNLIRKHPSSWNQKDIEQDRVRKYTYRQFLQIIGTDLFRNQIHQNVWVNALFADLKEDSDWIITDVRFENEAKMILNHNGYLIRINRHSDNPSTHPSETSLDNFHDFNFIINNDSDLNQLFSKVRTLYFTILDNHKNKPTGSIVYTNEEIKL